MIIQYSCTVAKLRIMYTFIVVYPYATQFKMYIRNNFDVVSRYKNVTLTSNEMNTLYSQGGYSRSLAKKKILANTAEGSNGYDVFLVRGESLRQILKTKRKLRNTIKEREHFKLSNDYNMFHSLDSSQEKLQMLKYLYDHTGDYKLAACSMHLVGIL